LNPTDPRLQVGQSLGVTLTGGEMVGKSCSNLALVLGISAASVNRTGGDTCWGHGTGSGAGKGETQPGSKVTAARIGSSQPSSEVLLNLLSNFARCIE
jgi:hypothetical protein